MARHRNCARRPSLGMSRTVCGAQRLSRITACFADHRIELKDGESPSTLTMGSASAARITPPNGGGEGRPKGRLDSKESCVKT
jgi:hypothetical protein